MQTGPPSQFPNGSTPLPFKPVKDVSYTKLAQTMALSSAVSFAVQPFEVIKTRMITEIYRNWNSFLLDPASARSPAADRWTYVPKYGSMSSTFRTIFTEEGGKALYRGLFPRVVKHAVPHTLGAVVVMLSMPKLSKYSNTIPPSSLSSQNTLDPSKSPRTDIVARRTTDFPSSSPSSSTTSTNIYDRAQEELSNSHSGLPSTSTTSSASSLSSSSLYTPAEHKKSKENKPPLHPYQKEVIVALTLGSITNNLAHLVLYPMEVCKTRLEAMSSQTLRSRLAQPFADVVRFPAVTEKPPLTSSLDTWNTLKYIAKNERYRGLFAGLLPGVASDFLFLSSQLVVVQASNLLFPNNIAGQAAGLVFGAAICTFLTQPFEIIKTQMQLMRVSPVDKSVLKFRDYIGVAQLSNASPRVWTTALIPRTMHAVISTYLMAILLGK